MDLYDDFVRTRWTNSRTRLTNFNHLMSYAPVPGRIHEALLRVKTHYITKALVDEAADQPQRIKGLHEKGDLWKYSRKVGDFTYGRYKSDQLYSAIWGVAILTGNRIAHVINCLSIRLLYETDDEEGLPASLEVRWGRRKGATSASTVEYSTQGLPVRVWNYVRDVWKKGTRPFQDIKGTSPASCVNRWLTHKHEYLNDKGLLHKGSLLPTSSSPRIFAVNRDLDLLQRGELTKERYEVRLGHTASVAERSYRRARATPTTVGRVRCGKKSAI